jgi:hypothetical protein
MVYQTHNMHILDMTVQQLKHSFYAPNFCKICPVKTDLFHVYIYKYTQNTVYAIKISLHTHPEIIITAAEASIC